MDDLGSRGREFIMNNITEVSVGVDVSKEKLDVHIYPADKSLIVENSIKGIDKILNLLQKYIVNNIICEASGGYESLLIRLSKQAKYNAKPVDPRRIKAFIFSEGINAKTDKIDAKMIAMFAHKKTFNFNENDSEDRIKLQTLVKRKNDFSTICASEKTRLKNPQESDAKKFLQSHIDFLQDQINKLEDEIEDLINSNEELKRKVEIIKSIPGLGKSISSILVAEIPELGTLNQKQIAAIVGLAPFNNESGKKTKKSFTKGGRFNPRKALYMGALSSTRHGTKLKKFYDKLVLEDKKPKKVALVAVMRKLIVIANSLIKKNQMWDDKIL